MAIPIKIQCDCGQRYAFDVETDRDLEPKSVACPVCGADGTVAANAVIARFLPLQPARAVAHADSSKIRLAVSTPSTQSRSRPTIGMGQLDPERARTEARAKIIWGDSREAVSSFLRMQGFNQEDAADTVRELFRERVNAVRAIGIRKIVTGIGLMAVPIITLIIFLSIGNIFMKVMAVAVMVGLWGAGC